MKQTNQMKRNIFSRIAVFLFLSALITVQTGCGASTADSGASSSEASEKNTQAESSLENWEGVDGYQDIVTATEAAASWETTKTPKPSVSTVGGEWMVLGLARSGLLTSQTKQAYQDNLALTAEKNKGKLSDTEYTEYARADIAAAAINESPLDVSGYNLLKPLTKWKNVKKQGTSAVAYALIALDANRTAGTDEGKASYMTAREKYISLLLDAANKDGGFGYVEGTSDPDMTSIAIQAMAPYYNGDTAVTEGISEKTLALVKKAVASGLSYLKNAQGKDGGFSSDGSSESSCESIAQVITALCSLNKIPESGAYQQMTENALDAMLLFQDEDGSFSHLSSGSGDAMATEQAAYALVSYLRSVCGKDSLYNMADASQMQPVSSDSASAKDSSSATSDAGQASSSGTCSLVVECKTIRSHMKELKKAKSSLVPSDGILFQDKKITIKKGESAEDILVRELKANHIQYDITYSAGYKSAYIKGIGNLYEMDCGDLSGWMYSVNGKFQNYAMNVYKVKDGDAIAVRYTCDMGKDLT